LIAAAMLIASCSQHNHIASTVAACGVTLWSGPEAIAPAHIESPPSRQNEQVPQQSELPPLAAQNGGHPLIFVLSNDCDHGVVVKVAAPRDYRTGVVANAKDGTIVGFTLFNPGSSAANNNAAHGNISVAVFSDGKETGYFQGQV
jgi:hypothetical protein